MAYAHYEVDENAKKPARDLMDTVRKLRVAWDEMASIRGRLIAQQDGATDFTSIAANYGYAGVDAAAKETNAQASFAEIDSNWSTVDSKIRQLCDRHL